jgi:uncharacterized protein
VTIFDRFTYEKKMNFCNHVMARLSGILILLIVGVVISGCSKFVAHQILNQSINNFSSFVSEENIDEWGFEDQRFCEALSNNCIQYLSAPPLPELHLNYTFTLDDERATQIDLKIDRSEPHQKHKGTVLLLHGSNTTKESMSFPSLLFSFYGYDVLIPDLLGYGESDGNYPSFGPADAKLLDKLLTQKTKSGQIKSPIYVLGNSMSSVTATHLAKRRSDISGVILLAPMNNFSDSVVNYVKNYGPWYSKLLSEDDIRAGANEALAKVGVIPSQTNIVPTLQDLNIPVLILVSDIDPVAPYDYYQTIEGAHISVIKIKDRPHWGLAFFGEQEHQVFSEWFSQF